jgi:hypothetical protein
MHVNFLALTKCTRRSTSSYSIIAYLSLLSLVEERMQSKWVIVEFNVFQCIVVLDSHLQATTTIDGNLN